MARLRVHVRIDLLRTHLSAEDREPKTEPDVLAWLIAAGFARADGPWWIVEERHLGHLQPSEVAAVEDAVTVHATDPATTSQADADDMIEAA
jgi:hypothetical protein